MHKEAIDKTDGNLLKMLLPNKFPIVISSTPIFIAASVVTSSGRDVTRATINTLHPGEVVVEGSFLAHSPEEFVNSTVKETENGKGWIVRGYKIS